MYLVEELVLVFYALFMIGLICNGGSVDVFFLHGEYDYSSVAS